MDKDFYKCANEQSRNIKFISQIYPMFNPKNLKKYNTFTNSCIYFRILIKQHNNFL